MQETGMRQKDQQLGTICLEAARAAVEGVEWLRKHREPSPQMTRLQRQLRRDAVDARRLAVAATRPMSVGVFGASQMGKSFLIGKLISPEHNPTEVVFGQGDQAVRQNFLTQVNPSGGDETTGLVTRFSLRRFKTPAGAPVVLRLLREVDIVKIIANTFRHDLRGDYKLQLTDDLQQIEDRSQTPDRLADLGRDLAARRGATEQPGFSLEDVYELRDYVEKQLEGHKLADPDLAAYWDHLEANLPYLAPDARARALAPLWAELEEFTALFSQLKGALDLLGHPERIFTGLSALADRSKGVLHVNTLRELDAREAAPELEVKTLEGRSYNLPICVVTALTAELCVTLDHAPWDFFTHTDLLDFPGARSRENKTVGAYLRDPSEPMARSNCFLRGKVAVLFDNYAEDLDLNVMLLCAGPENQEVKSLPDLIKNWVIRTHGATPEERAQKLTALFYCLTKCDLLFTRKLGLEAPVRQRIENNFKPYPWWAETWTPGKPFDNTFLIRNPSVEASGLFDYGPREDLPQGVIPPEVGLTADFQDYLANSFHGFYHDEPMVQRHVAQADEKLKGVLALNDGGTGLLARALAPVCNPDLKYDQILPRAKRVQAAIRESLEGFHESGDLNERAAQRRARISGLLNALWRNKAQVGPFLADFQIAPARLETAYRAYRRSNIETPKVVDDFDELFGDAPARPKVEPKAAPLGFGLDLLEAWDRFLREAATGSAWVQRLDISDESLRGFVEELQEGARRLELARLLVSQVDGFTSSAMPLDEAARRIGIFAANLFNDALNLPGGPKANALEGRFQPHALKLAAGQKPESLLPLDPTTCDPMQVAWLKEWIKAMFDLTFANATSSGGASINLEANNSLGAILQRLSGDYHV